MASNIGIFRSSKPKNLSFGFKKREYDKNGCDKYFEKISSNLKAIVSWRNFGWFELKDDENYRKFQWVEKQVKTMFRITWNHRI